MRIARIGGSWLAVACILLAGLSCSDDDNDLSVDPETPFPHAVPTAASMQMDLQELEGDGIAPAPEGVCHALTAVVVTWVNANVIVRLAIPVAAFHACITQPPVYLGDQTWRWTASGGSGANAWTAELTGEVIAPIVVQWTMRVSGTANQLDRFLWFDGTCDTDARDGVWHYYDHTSPTSPLEIVRCDWSLPQSTALDKEIAFENVQPDAPNYGDVVQYSVADSIVAVLLEDASEETEFLATWDLRDGTGHAVNAANETCCWGERPLYPDIECP